MEKKSNNKGNTEPSTCMCGTPVPFVLRNGSLLPLFRHLMRDRLPSTATTPPPAASRQQPKSQQLRSTRHTHPRRISLGVVGLKRQACSLCHRHPGVWQWPREIPSPWPTGPPSSTARGGYCMSTKCARAVFSRWVAPVLERSTGRELTFS